MKEISSLERGFFVFRSNNMTVFLDSFKAPSKLIVLSNLIDLDRTKGANQQSQIKL